MPKLNELIQIGFCSGYGDADFRVSGRCANLTRKELDELKLMTLVALNTADEMWRHEQMKKPENQAAQAIGPTG